MLDHIISRVRRILKDARQKLSVESAAAVENLYRDIVSLNDYIVRELDAVESNSKFDQKRKKAARRSVFEQAARKLEVIKARSTYSNIDDSPEAKLIDKPAKEEISLLQFFREKEVRDRLFGMSEAQILSLYGDSLFDGSNALLINAILNAPEGFEPLSKEALKKIRQSGAEKFGTRADNGSPKEPGFESATGEVLSLVKKELDNLRRKELPESLTQPKGSKDRPFKF